MEEDREPCPIRIVEDLGIAFGMGLIGGSIWHGVVGYRRTIPVNTKKQQQFFFLPSSFRVINGMV